MGTLYRYSILAQVNITGEELKTLPNGAADSASVATILEIAFGALGSAAFIIVVVAGLKFVLSRGNPDAVAKARNTIVYAAIGLVISMLSFAIVRFIVRSI